MQKTQNIVLVHGGFVDGSGWRSVYDILKSDGFNVSVVQNPTLSLAGDVAAVKLVVEAQAGPVVLVGHSYGGAVITEAGVSPNVAALVYITAFAPDKGESVSSLIANPPPGAPAPPILPPKDGYLFLDKAKFPAAFAADVDARTAAFMAESQVPWGVDAVNGAITEPAWKTKPSWYLIVTDDKMIPPQAQRFMSKRAGSTVVEVPGSHAIYVSNPQAVASLIAKAAEGATADGPEAVRAARDEFDNAFDVPLSPTEAWPLLSDIGRIAACMPGVELTEVVNDTTYQGKISISLGPMPLTFSGVVKIENLDPDNRTARITAQGVGDEGRAFGAASFQIKPTAGGSKVLVHTDLNLSGPAARFGQSAGAVQSVAARTLEQFAANLRARFPGAPAG